MKRILLLFLAISLSQTIIAQTIFGPSSVQACCDDIVQFCGAVFHDPQKIPQFTSFSWSVGGGTIISGQGSPCINVAIDQSAASLSVSFSAATVYSDGSSEIHTGNRLVVKTAPPQVSNISGSPHACIGDDITLCVDEICGLVDMNWNIPSEFTIINQDKTCITIEPNSNTPVGTEVNITAQATLIGGCTSTSPPKKLTIYKPKTPPCPVGIAAFEFRGSDPCKDDDLMEVRFFPNTPYINGITTITPNFVSAHSNNNTGDKIDVEVCNINPCTGEECCEEYTLTLPAPCEPNPTKPSPVFREVKQNLSDIELEIFPNPANHILNLKSNADLNGQISIYNLQGIKVLEQNLRNVSFLNLDLSTIQSNGMYYVVIQNGEDIHTKKITIKK